MGLEHATSEKRASVARRVFENHEITGARGAHAGREANFAYLKTENTVGSAKAIAGGFLDAVTSMNKNFTDRREQIESKQRAKEEVAR